MQKKTREKDDGDDNKRKWIWVKFSKLLSLKSNIKGIVGRGNYENLN